MPSSRIISSSMYADEWYGLLDDFEGNLWTGLFAACADMQGRLLNNPALIRSILYPYRDVPIHKINAAIEKFHNDKKVLCVKLLLNQFVVRADERTYRVSIPLVVNQAEPDAWCMSLGCTR